MIISGQVEHIVWSDVDERVFIFKMKLESGGRCGARGVVPTHNLLRGLNIHLEGDFEDTKYGKTFVFKRFGLKKDNTVQGIVCYLQSMVESIGPITAKRIVDKFGVDTVNVMMNEPKRLKEFPEFTTAAGAARLKRIVKSFQQTSREAVVMSFFMGSGLGVDQSRSLFRKWGDKAIDIVKENPYKLMAIDRFGFIAADKVAYSLGVSADDPNRIMAAIYHSIVDVGQRNGHVYLTRSEVYSNVLDLANRPGVRRFGRDILESEIREMCIRMAAVENQWCRLHIEENRIYPRWSYDHERYSAQRVVDMIESGEDHRIGTDEVVESFLTKYQDRNSINFSEQQLSGFRMAVNNRIMVLTGLPGTGKTTLMKAVVDYYTDRGLDFQLMAPTGIAAKRLSEITKFPAKTIHRCLRYKGATWDVNSQEPLPADAAVIDEFSMVDQEVFYHLLNGLRPEARLLMVGDPSQLPSVGPGNVLWELTQVGLIPHVALTEIYRQEKASDIVTNSHRIVHGLAPEILEGKDKDFHFFNMQDEDQILGHILHACERLTALDKQFQVISPRHAGTLGVSNLNDAIRDRLNPLSGQAELKVSRDRTFREHDRVMITRNDYEREVYNGDVGRIVAIIDNNLVIDIESAVQPIRITLPKSEARTILKLAYAITVHKSQGQEHDMVIMPFVSAFGIMLQRNLFYTAVTRAKKKVFIYGNWNAIVRAVGNSRVKSRNTYLSNRILEVAV